MLLGMGVLWVAATPLGADPKLAVVTVDAPSDLEQYAASELCSYLDKLFGITSAPGPRLPDEAEAAFIVGAKGSVRTPDDLADQVARLGDQGILLRTTQWQGLPAIILAGGSPRATLWAVYELAHRWGMRSLLHGDVLPPRRPFELPELNVALEPLLPVRQWRVVNDFPMGPESWGMDDYRPVLDQLAKMKFNRIFVSIYQYQPFFHFEVDGIKRSSADLWFDYHYPITDDMVGRELFGDEPEFWNPDLPMGAGYEEFVAAGVRHVRELMSYAKQRGMDVAISATLTEFPPEFAPLLPGAVDVCQLGAMGVVPGKDTPIDDPGLTKLATAVLQATVETYPQADFVALGTPEWRQWTGRHEPAWQALDRKYGVEKTVALEDVLAQARARTGYPGGAERALQEVQGDIVTLHFYDRLLSDVGVLQGTGQEDVKIILNSVSEELFPILPSVLPEGAEILAFVDYTPSRIVERREVLKNMPSGQVPMSLIYTLHDDNVGVLPQLMTAPLHELTLDLRQHGWAGFSTRYWMVADHDPCLAYLSRAAWDASLTPESAYRDQIAAASGPDAVADMLQAFDELGQVSELLEWEGLGLAFPVPGMMMKHWQPGETPQWLLEARAGYQRALDAASRALAATPEGRREYAEYWVGRLGFGVRYLEAIESMRRAATAESKDDAAGALRHGEAALKAAQDGLEQFASVVLDRSDLGALATMNEYVYRPLRAKLAELRDQ